MASVAQGNTCIFSEPVAALKKPFLPVAESHPDGWFSLGVPESSPGLPILRHSASLTTLEMPIV